MRPIHPCTRRGLTDGRLVIFAGAGVSRDSPTELPDFKGLAEELGQSAKIEQLPGEELERYLGRIADSGFPLHQQAAARIDRAKDANRLHRALVKLARRAEDSRIVTLEDFGHVSGLHWTYVGSIERGRRNPGLINILRLADALDVDPAKLVNGL